MLWSGAMDSCSGDGHHLVSLLREKCTIKHAILTRCVRSTTDLRVHYMEVDRKIWIGVVGHKTDIEINMTAETT